MTDKPKKLTKQQREAQARDEAAAAFEHAVNTFHDWAHQTGKAEERADITQAGRHAQRTSAAAETVRKMFLAAFDRTPIV